MELRSKQFKLWHLIATVTMCAVVFAAVRALTRGGIGGISPAVWVAIGIVIGHNSGVMLLAWIDPKARPDSWSRSLIVWKALLAWSIELGATALALWLITDDSDFAIKNSLWLGTGFFFCLLVLYEVFRPYRVERRAPSDKEFLRQLINRRAHA